MKVVIRIDGREVTVEDGRDLLSTCLAEGVAVPHFCWHGALGSVGACRLCAVKVHDGPDDAEGRIEMACTQPVREGLVVDVDAPEAREFRARVIEWLMVNHPHDCAVCEEGGACHLQDMTVATGHVRRRHRFAKRTHRNQFLGPLLTHEMNRCIACYRCTRFYRGYAGGRDLDVFGAHDRVYFGRAEDGVLENPFAGNLAEVCPTGVFNDKGWSKDYARKWDMRATPSVCAHCSVGCNLFVAERGGRVRRAQNRYHGAINGYFLCDRGRFGALHAATAARVTPKARGQEVSSAEAFAAARAAVAAGAVGIGSPRATVEANWALRRLVGPAAFFAGVSDAEAALARRMVEVLRAGPARVASLKDIETADAALVLGEDLTGTAPRAALALRQAARGAERALAAEKGVPAWMDNACRVAGEGRRSPIALVGPAPDALDDVATWSLRKRPDAVAAFGFAVAAALKGDAGDDEAGAVAKALAAAAAPVVIAGAGLGTAGPVEAAAAVCAALGPKAQLALFPPEANSMGLALLGGDGLEAAVAALEAGAARTALVLEADLYERAPAETVERLFAAAESVVVLDSLETRTSARADGALPVANFAEAAGTYVNHEGRAQRLFAAVPDGPPAAWRVLARLGGGAEERLDDLIAAIAADGPALAGIADAAPGAGLTTTLGRIARGPRPLSGRTAQDLAGRVPAGAPPRDPDSALGWTMEGARGAAQPTALRTGYETAGLHSASAAPLFLDDPQGSLKGGDPGARLIEGGEGGLAPAAAEAKPAGEGLLVAVLHDPFSATETDRASPLIAARAPAPRLVLNPTDAKRLGIGEGDAATLDGAPYPAPVTLDKALPRGTVGVSRSLLPRWPLRRVAVEAAP